MSPLNCSLPQPLLHARKLGAMHGNGTLAFPQRAPYFGDLGFHKVKGTKMGVSSRVEQFCCDYDNYAFLMLTYLCQPTNLQFANVCSCIALVVRPWIKQTKKSIKSSIYIMPMLDQ